MSREHTASYLAVERCFTEPDPVRKCALAGKLTATIGRPVPAENVPGEPGRPQRPALVHPRDLPRRQLGTPAGHAAFVHAICHIEFTAINLALDAVIRFRDMPAAYYADWIEVAKDEAVHYALLAAHLESLGYCYGDFAAHDGLWDMALRTGDDILRRMALVPRVMEARGLDVTPAMIDRLNDIGDGAGARLLERILADEIGHVAVGSRWFEYVCRERGLTPERVFIELVHDELGGARAANLNRPARLAAGFTAAELDCLARGN